MTHSDTTFCGISNSKMQTAYQPKALFGVVGVNGQAIALFRICLALLALHDLFFEALPYWGFLYSDYGIIRADESYTEVFRAFFNYSDNPYYQAGLLTVYTLALVGLLVGFRARLCVFIAFLIFTALIERNIEVVSNIDRLMGCFMLWACFLPLDRYWSVAAALRDDTQRNKPWPLIPILAVKLQIMIIYLDAGLFKLTGAPWMNGTALQYVVQDQYFGSYEGAYLFALMPDIVLKIAAWSIVALQISFSFLIYMPWKRDFFRAVALIGAVLMHVGFIVFMQVHQFPYLCFVYLLLLVPDRWINKMLFERREKLSKIRIFYDPDCGFCRAVSLIFKEFCLGPTAKVLPADSNQEALSLLHKHNSWVVYGHEGGTYLKWEAVAYILKQSPVFWIFGYTSDLFFMKKSMQAVYNLIGDNRHFLGNNSRFFLNPLPEIYPEKIAQIACLILIFIAFSLTTLTLPRIKDHVHVTQYLQKAAAQASIIQWWDIFAPEVASEHYSFTVYAIDKNGISVNLEPYKSDHFYMNHDYMIFSSHRILSYYRRMTRIKDDRNRMGYARYMCKMTQVHGRPAYMIFFKMTYQHTQYKDWREEFGSSYECSDILPLAEKS